MIRVDLNFKLTDLNRKPITDTAGAHVAIALYNSVEKINSLKFGAWAFQLNDGLALELDESDFELFKLFINNCETITTAVKYPVLKCLIDCKK